MTYTQAIRELHQSPERYTALTNALIASFLDVENVPQNKLALREQEIEDFCAVLVNHLLTARLKKQVRLELMDLIEQLRLAIDVLAVRSGKVTIEELERAGAHMAKKMQSSFSDPNEARPPSRVGKQTISKGKTSTVSSAQLSPPYVKPFVPGGIAAYSEQKGIHVGKVATSKRRTVKRSKVKSVPA